MVKNKDPRLPRPKIGLSSDEINPCLNKRDLRIKNKNIKKLNQYLQNDPVFYKYQVESSRYGMFNSNSDYGKINQLVQPYNEKKQKFDFITGSVKDI